MSDNIFIATSSFGVHSSAPLDLINDKGYDTIINPLSRKLNSDELIQYASNSIGIIAGTENYSKTILNQLHNLKTISRLGVGIDNIDLDYANKKGIKLFTTSTSPALAVSELSLGLMIDLYRNLSNSNNKLKLGNWDKYMGRLLSGKILGIIGLGNIGKTFVKLVQGFNLDILAFDEIKDNAFAEKNKVTYCDIDTLLTKSDIVSLHLNLSDKTQNFLNEERLNMMKPGSILINTSRGEVVDEESLYKILKEEKIFGAGLDVFRNEPYSGNLLNLNNVIVTPHIGSYAREIRIKMELESIENLIRGLKEI